MFMLKSDYCEGAHPQILQALIETNGEQTSGYGEDPHCEHAREMIRELIDRPDADVHFLVGGTQTNLTVIAAALRPHEAVISAASGHPCVHETGAVEATGHKVIAMPAQDGKLTAEAIDEACAYHSNEHMVKPKMVYISQSTEVGTIYSRAELQAIRTVCDRWGLLLFVDGARLGSALTCEANDIGIRDIARMADVFYIGGTKNGALFGEALVLLNPELKTEFRYLIKQRGGMLAKGRLLGIQFEELLRDGLYFSLAKRANDMAKLLREGLAALGYFFYSDSPTNQLFPIMPDEVLDGIAEFCEFEEQFRVDEHRRCVRFCTSWATPVTDINAILNYLRSHQ